MALPRLGRNPRKYGAALHYSALVAGKAPAAPPPPFDYAANIDAATLGMLGNDQYGDCCFAAVGHARQVWTFNALNDERSMTTAEALAMYSAVTGFNPSIPSSDQGANIQDVLAYWQKIGAPIGPGAVNKIAAWIEVDVRNTDDVATLASQCGGLDIGINLPSNVYVDQIPLVWEYDPSATIEGGHDVYVTGVNAQGNYSIISWGQKYTITAEFFANLCDEAYGIADPGWIGWSGKTPAGLTLAELESAMAALRAS